MYQVILKGYFETIDPDKLIEEIQTTVKNQNSEIVGNFNVYQLAPYVDFQKDDIEEGNKDSDL